MKSCPQLIERMMDVPLNRHPHRAMARFCPGKLDTMDDVALHPPSDEKRPPVSPHELVGSCSTPPKADKLDSPFPPAAPLPPPCAEPPSGGRAAARSSWCDGAGPALGLKVTSVTAFMACR